MLVPGGRVVRATTVFADRVNNVAVLRAQSLEAPALPLADQPPTGTPVGVLGYSNDGPLVASPPRSARRHGSSPGTRMGTAGCERSFPFAPGCDPERAAARSSTLKDGWSR